MTAAAPAVPRVAWDELYGSLRWRQGEHVTLVGPTGRGKTTLLKHLLRVREDAGGHVAAVATKPRDSSIDALKRRGYRRVRSWDDVRVSDRLVLLWPPFRTLGGKWEQRDAIGHALAAIFEAGGWCLALDELHYVCDDLSLSDDVTMLLKQGRSVGISVVGSTQRPRHVPLAALNQATHVWLWGIADHYDLKRMSELGGADSGAIRATLPTLARHEVLYVNTRDGDLAVTQPPK